MQDDWLGYRAAAKVLLVQKGGKRLMDIPQLFKNVADKNTMEELENRLEEKEEKVKECYE